MKNFLHGILRRASLLPALLLLATGAFAQNNAAFVSQSVPADMSTGQPYAVAVTMKNTGSTVWGTATHKLGSQNPTDNVTWGANRVLLTRSVSPGQTYTFSATVLAPAYGTANFQWQMGEEGVGYFGPLTPNVAVNVTTGNNAAYVSQSVPATMIAGQGYPVSITYKNTGTTTWTASAGIKLGSLNPTDNVTWGANRLLVNGSVSPGQTYTFAATTTAPATPGTYNFQWQMGQEGIEYFGPASPNVAVNVVPAPPAVSVSRTPNPMVAGRSFTLTWSTTGATALSRNCTATTGGFVSSGAMTLSGSSTGTADVAWVGHPSSCSWVATGAGGTTTVAETMTTVLPPVPVVTVTRTPTPMVGGQPYTLSWTTTDANTLTRNCTSTGTGYTDNSTLAVNGAANGTASRAWVGYPSTCTWTATGYGGTGKTVETVTTVPGPEVTYFHNDISGTPMLATDENGQVVWKETYQPYGSRLNNQAASSGNKLWFAGKAYDGSTGLSYMGARYYDPVIGRFVGVDPKEVDLNNIHGLNRYAYGNNNPYRYLDRDGREAIPAIKAWWEASVAGFKSDSLMGTVDKALSGFPVEGAALGAMGAMKSLGSEAKLIESSKAVEAARMGDAATAARKVAEPVFKTTKEAQVAAEALGFQRINETVHEGQAVFKRGKDYITRDLDGHNGGAWKMADSVKNLGSKETRAGTFDAGLRRIGD